MKQSLPNIVAIYTVPCASLVPNIMEKYISGMPVASSQYWNCVHGRAPGEAAYDAEGMQTMRTLGRNMAFLIKSIALGKKAYGVPEKEPWQGTHFVRDDLKG